MHKSIIMTLALAVMLVSGSAWAASTPTKTNTKVAPELDAKKIVTVATEFISKYLVDGAKVEVKVKNKEGNVYNLTIKIDGGTEISSAISSNGKYFYPTVMDVDKVKKDKAAVAKPQTTAVKAKSDKPTVELFVMSHCPYGTQIEKGILPVLETLGSKVDFKLKFVDYVMHGQKEIDEQLNQYCISQEQNDKLLPYLKCFLSSGDSTTCLASTKVNNIKLKACLTSSDSKFKISVDYKDKTKWSGSFPPFGIHKAENDKYGVQGSPTLVINGALSSSGRDSASLLTAIRGAFNKPPSECQTKLSGSAPTPGFGWGTTNATASAGCGQ